MKSRFFLFSAILMVALISAVAVSAADKVDSPVYQQWAKFKVGTLAKYHQVNDMAGAKTESDIIYTLLEITPEKVVVEMSGEMNVAGQKMEMPKTKMEYPAKVDAGDPVLVKDQPKPDVKQGEEEVDVAGTKYKCKTIETKIDQQGTTGTSKIWSCDTIPGTLVKSETELTAPAAGKTSLVLTEVKLP